MKPAELNKTAVAITAIVCLSGVASFGIWVNGPTASAVADADRAFRQAREGVARVFVGESLTFSTLSYRRDMGDYPSTEEGIKALITAPAGQTTKWRGPYIRVIDDKLPLDPWGQEYQYRCPGKKNPDSYDFFSCGSDKLPGTADDIGNW